MTEVSTCVICDGEISRTHSATVAPFLATRIWDRKPFCVDLVKCKSCGFTFYNPRLDAAEEARLYDSYRSPEYQKMRQSSEPWYSARFNEDLASAESYEVRRRVLADLLRQHAGRRQISRVLDYGGDRGDLVCGLIDGAAAFVYDISGIPAAEGVTATTDPAACQPDLIVNSNVLEHVGFPRRLMNAMLQAAPSGSLIFVETPSESPLDPVRLFRRVAQLCIMALRQPALAPSVLRPSSLYMMHEHVNYFTRETLGGLMRVCGCTPIASGTYVLNGRAGKTTLAWCLGMTQ